MDNLGKSNQDSSLHSRTIVPNISILVLIAGTVDEMQMVNKIDLLQPQVGSWHFMPFGIVHVNLQHPCFIRFAAKLEIQRLGMLLIFMSFIRSL